LYGGGFDGIHYFSFYDRFVGVRGESGHN